MEKKTEKVRLFYTALAQGDFETVSALLADDLVWHQPGKGALSGIYNGKQNVFAHLGKMAQLSNGTFAIDQVDYVTENGDLVVAAIGFAVSASGHSMEMKGVDLFRFENGLIKEVWLFSEQIEEEDRFWNAIVENYV
ncbi:nuclear transport factor 2 family protein [Prevotella sp. OH937_COT-195]|uniref:nuclear transport factor 2 family protein n=1 Tax=Prevotella sp. OH937_COT-195 TaxID=2491051 RepID=UPI000F650FF0|nr:nuclear transport factor 2 family protein [Prevotella sp. OH937_COT-195]RRC96605.1 nuclear transport factor 2 family protein [Prevotella sp. OH937_COT-195]